MKKFLLSFASLFMLTLMASAQIKPEHMYGISFNTLKAVSAGIRTYAKDIVAESGETSGLQDLVDTDWTQTENGDAHAGGIFAYGDTISFLGGGGFYAPATGPLNETTGNTLGIVAVWGATSQYTKSISLASGIYELTVPVYNAGGTAEVTDLIGYGGKYASNTTFPVGEWTTVKVQLILTENKPVAELSLGYKSNGGGSAANPHLFIGDIDIYKTGTAQQAQAAIVEEAKANVNAYLDGITTGDGLFSYSAESIAKAKAAVEAATTVEEVEAAKALVSINAPVAGQAYKLGLTTSEGTYYLSTANGIAIQAEATPIYFVAQGDGTYAISNGTEYVNYEGSDNWTMTATAEAYGWTISPVEGGYTIQGKNGLLGTNTSDGAAVGSPLYGDKTTTNGYAVWSIISNDYTSYIPNAGLSDASAWNTENTKGISGGICKVSSGKSFDFSQTITLPAGQYKMTANAAYRYSGSEADEYTAIAAGTDTHYAKIYATTATHNYTGDVKNRWEGATDAALEGTSAVEVNGKYVPNSSADVQAYMNAGQYTNELVFNVQADGQVKIGIEKTESPEAGDYTVIGAWTLTRIGDAEADPIPVITYKGVVEQTLSHPVAGVMGTTVTNQTVGISKVAGSDDLVNITFSGFELPMAALGSFPEFTIENVATTVSNNTTHFAAGNFQVSMPKGQMTVNYNGELTGIQNGDEAPMFHLTLQNATTDNVYFGADATAIEAYKAYESQPTVTFPVTLLTEEATMDNWKITNSDTFHLNTWSTEADESGMKTPFIEAWRGAGNNLNDATISYTQMTGLTPGSYTVKIFARAFNESNTTDYPSGITFFANDTKVNMAEVGTTSLFNNSSTVLYGNLSADCTVGEDGTLNIGFELASVTGDWLAFKNLEVIYNDPNIPEVTAVEGKMGAEAAANQTAAIEAYNANPTPETYEAAKAAIAAAQKSADYYAPISKLDEAGLAAFPYVEEYNAGTLDETANINEALVAAEKAQTTPGSDLTLVATSTTWTGQSGTYGTAVERYSGTAYNAESGKVLYQHIEGLQPGTYEVQFYATANMAWIGAATGADIAQLFVNNDTYPIEVIGQVGCTPSDYLRTYEATVGNDGILEYGLQNIAEGGNWYVAQAIGLKLVELVPQSVDIAGTWYEQTTGMYYGNDWAAFSLKNNEVTVAVDGTTATFTGLLGDNTNALTATIDGSNLTFAKSQAIAYDGYDWELCYDPTGYATEATDLVGTISEDGKTITLDGLSLFYADYSCTYMYDTKISLTREKAEEPEPVPGDIDFADAIITLGAQAMKVVPCTDKSDISKWYLLKQKRGGVTPLYDNGEEQTVMRATTDCVADNSKAADVAQYLVRFIPTENEGAYNIQFGTGRYFGAYSASVSSSTTMVASATPGEYNVYNINGEDGHIGINLYNMDGVLDNNAAGNSVVFWSSGEVTSLDGNNDWTIWDVEVTEASEEQKAQAERNAQFAALLATAESAYNTNQVYVKGDALITSVDQLSSPYTETSEGSFANLLDGDASTFWHSAWSGGDVDAGVHYLEIALPDNTLGYVELDLTRRANASNDHLTKADIVGVDADGNATTVTTIDLPYVSSNETVTAIFNLDKAYSSIRIVEEATNANRGYWHAGELQLYKVDLDETCYNAQNPVVAANLAEVIAGAKTVENATQENIDDLQAAYDSYLAGDSEGETVGNEDNTSGWWTAFSSFYEINKGQVATISFDNYNAGNGANWNNWLLIAQKQNVKVNGAGSDEYFALRNDNYGWGGHYGPTTLTNDFDWDNFISDMNGSHVDMVLSMNDNGEIAQTSVITTAAGKTYNYAFTSAAVADVEGFEFFFTVELSHIKNLKVQIADVTAAGATAISNVTTTATKANGKYMENGKVVIYRNGIKYNSNGVALK